MGRILAVDDDALAQAVITDALKGLGHEATVVGSGAAALAQLAEGGFDLVIVDVVMPGMGGLDLADAIRALPTPVPVLLVSAARRPPVRADIVGFLPKPLDTDRLGRFLDVFFRRGSAKGVTPPGPWTGAEFLATVDGTIERFPPARALFLAHRVGASGALTIQRGGLDATIGVRNGRVVYVRGVPALFASLSPPIPDGKDLASDLGNAVAAGHAPDHALRAAAEGLGAFLGDMVDTRGGRVAFDSGWALPGAPLPLPEPIPRLIALGLQRARSDARLTRAWQALERHGVQRRVPSDSSEDRWGLDAMAMRIFRVVPRVRTVQALLQETVAADPARRAEILRAIDVLHVLGLLVVDGGSLDGAGLARGSNAAESTQTDPRSGRLAAALAAMEVAHPVEVLELNDRRKLTDEDVANAYRDISRRYHPDTFFSAPPSVRGLAERCFARVNAAYDALRGPGGLHEGRRFLDARAHGVPFVSEKDYLAGRVAFRRAEPFMRNHDWKAADAHLQEAVRLDPRSWPYGLHAAWSGWLAQRLDTAAALAAIDALAPPEKVRLAEAQVYAGNILKQEGRLTEALERYRAAAKLHPDNHDAQRELRLHEKRTPPPAPPPKGIFGGLLKPK
jgi:CheY-like chemotaxis protein